MFREVKILKTAVKALVCAVISLYIICIGKGTANAIIPNSEEYAKTYMVEADGASIAGKKLNIKKTSGASMAFAPKNTEITVIADSKVGYKLSGWEITEYGNGSIDTTPYTADGNSINVTVYDKNLKIKPIYERQEYTVTFSNSTLMSKTDDSYKCGSSKITVNANFDDVIKARAFNKTGYKVYKWEVTVIDSDSDGKMILSTFDAAMGSSVIELKVSSFNYEVTPIYIKKQYELYVCGFNTDIEGAKLRNGTEGSWCLTDWGTPVTATAKSIDGKRFKEWNISGIELPENVKKHPVLSFEMPLSDVKINAVYTDIPSPVQTLPENAEKTDISPNIAILIISFLLGVFLLLLAKMTNKRRFQL